MCGIVAQIGVGDPHRRSRALAALAHRGPDNEGEWSCPDPPVWLGHRRLAIVDLSPSGNQPMTNEDGSLHLVCNGEIYNAPALRAQLEGLGHRFSSHSDSETILHAYESWGDACVEHLEGMFAFALWDGQRRRLLAARDRVGIKPLCYAETPDGLILASEASAVLALLPQRPDPDPEGVAFMLFYSYVTAPRTIWKGIAKLEPGHMLVWEAGSGVRRIRYWEPPRDLDAGGDHSAQRWAELFEGVVEEHLLADVPMGLFLSGGLDSASVALALKNRGHAPEALTLGFANSPQSEAAIAAETAAHLGLPHRGVALSSVEIPELAARVMARADEPVGNSAWLPLDRISEQAARDYKVVLAGDGGDEAFGGYPRYQNLAAATGGRSPWIRRGLRPLVKRFASPGLRRMAAQRFSWSSPLHRHGWRLLERFLPEEIETLLAPMGLRFNDDLALEPLGRHFEPRLPLMRALQRIDLMIFCGDNTLVKADRCSMAHGLEIRVPFLDRRILEWSLSRPFDPLEESESKPVLRDYLRGRVPEAVLNHPKQGFSLRWDSGGGFDLPWALDQIEAGPWVRRGWFDRSWRRLVAPGVPNRQGRIWSLFMLTRWGEAWL